LEAVMEPTTEEEEIFALLCAHYVQRADARQQSMGLQSMEAETRDLARFIARLNTRPAQAGNALVEELEHLLLLCIEKGKAHSQWTVGSVEWRRETAQTILDALNERQAA
jgi:hypothetical protein